MTNEIVAGEIQVTGEQHTYKIFVYGTLKRNHRANHLLKNGTFLGEARTTPKYVLYSLGPYPIMTAGEMAVKGEIWEVNIKTLAALDRYEGHPHFYMRSFIELEDGSTVQAYLVNHLNTQYSTETPLDEWA